MKKKAVRIVVVIAVVLLLAVVAVRSLVPADAVKDFLFAQLEARTGLRATAEEASIRFPWPVGLRLKGLTISGGDTSRPGMPRVEGEIEELTATADLWSLLRKRPQVQEIRLESPRLELWMDASPAKKGGTPGPGAVGDSTANSIAPGAMALALLSIEDGRITVHAEGGRTFRLEGLDQRAHARLLPDGTFTARLEGGLAHYRQDLPPLELSDLALRMEATGRLQPLQLHLRFTEGSIGGVQWEGPVELEDTGGRVHLHGELQWTAGVEALRRNFAALDASSLPSDLQWDYHSAGGTVRGEGFLPPPGATPRQWLALVSVRGAVEDLRVGAYGRDDLLRGNLDFVQQGNTLTLHTGDLSVPGCSMRGSIEMPVMGEGSASGRFDAVVDAQAAEELLRSIWPELPESLRTKASPPERWPEAAGRVDGRIEISMPWPPPSPMPADAVRSTWTIHRVALRMPSLPDSLILTAGRLRLEGKELEIEDLQLSGPAMEGRIGGRLLSDSSGRNFVGEAAFTRIDLDRLMSRPTEESHASLSPRWWKVPEARAAGAETTMPAPPEDLSARLRLRCDRLLTRGYAFEDLRGELDLQDQVMELDDLTARLGDGHLSGQARIDWKAPQPRWTLQTRVEALPSQEILAPLAPRLASALSTVLAGRLELAGAMGEDGRQILSALSGEATLKGGAGKLITAQLLGKGLASLPAGAAAKLNEIPFHEFLTHLQLDQGRVHFDETVLKGPTRLQANGWVGLDGRVDYHLEVKLPAQEKLDLGSLTPLVEFLRTEDGRITIPVHVEGDGSKPSISLELDSARSRAQGEATRSVTDKLRGLLKGLGKKGGG